MQKAQIMHKPLITQETQYAQKANSADMIIGNFVLTKTSHIMGVQESFIKIKGKVGDLTFYKTRDGYQVREKKSSLTAARIATDPKFKLTRQNGMEFGRAGRNSKALRFIFRKAMLNIADSRVTSRLTTTLLQIIKSDDENRRGERVLLPAMIGQLAGFQFNAASSFYDLFHVMCWGHLDREAGNANFFTEGFIPEEDLKTPQGSHSLPTICCRRASRFRK